MKNSRLTARNRSTILTIAFALLAVLAGALGQRLSSAKPAVPRVEQRGMDRVVQELFSDVRGRVERQPWDPQSWGQYGMCLLQHERPREALLCFGQARKLDPGNPRWPWYTVMILEQTDLAAAAVELEQAFALAPDALHVRLKLAATKLALGDATVAEELLQEIPPESAAAADSVLQRVRAARLRNAPLEALKILDNARKRNSGLSSDLYQEAAVAALQAGQPQLAASLRAESLLQPPLQPFPDPWLAALRAFDVSGGVDSAAADQLRGQGRLPEAAARLAALARRFPDRSRPALNLALTLRDQGQLEQAANDLQDLAGRFPMDPLVHFHLAVTYAQLGQQDAAVKSLHICLQIKPDYGLARSALADLLAAAGRSPEAVSEAERAVADSPGELWVHFGLVRLLLSAGQLSRARQVLDQTAALPTAAGALEQAELRRLREDLQAAEKDSQGGAE